MSDWRRAGAEDLVGLLDLERAANLVGLAHVFAAEEHPFPEDDVLARWMLVLDDPDAVVDVVDGPDGLLAVAAYDARSLRHLAVDPDAWGSGLGREGVGRAVAAGARQLWVLELNHRARRLYEHLGWRPTGATQECPWPPHPTELEYERPLGCQP